jgi:hypothetical protein
MRNKFLIIGLAMNSFAFGQSDSTCVAITTKNISCKIKVNVDTTNYCHHHSPNLVNVNRCNGISKSSNEQCKLKTKHESGLCHHHRPKNN